MRCDYCYYTCCKNHREGTCHARREASRPAGPVEGRFPGYRRRRWIMVKNVGISESRHFHPRDERLSFPSSLWESSAAEELDRGGGYP